MNIHSDILKKIIEPVSPLTDKKNIQVSLFVVGKKAASLKKINFKGITSERLKRWKIDQRFVTIIETNESVYAHASEKFAQLLQQQDNLSVNGKRVSVSALSESEYHRLDEVFEDYLCLSSEEDVKQEESQENAEMRQENAQTQLKQYFARYRLLSNQMIMHFLIAQMKNIPSKIVLLCLQKMNEHARQQAQLAREERKIKDLKQHYILKTEIKKDQLKREILTEEIQKQAKRLSKPYKIASVA
jgi:hypothetical protein